jgi:hypothetical protein
MNVVQLPTHSLGDVSGGLRRLADEIDAGKYRDAYNVVWIVDCGSGTIALGMLGQSAEPGAVSLLLMKLAERKIIDGILLEAK